MSSRNRSEEKAARYAASPAGIAGKEKKRLKQMDLLAAGVAPEDLVSKKFSRTDYGSKKEYQAAVYQGRRGKIAPEMAAKYAGKAPEMAAKYAADKDANDALCRAAQAAAGFSAEDLGRLRMFTARFGPFRVSAGIVRTLRWMCRIAFRSSPSDLSAKPANMSRCSCRRRLLKACTSKSVSMSSRICCSVA